MKIKLKNYDYHLQHRFQISRGAKHMAELFRVEIEQDGAKGRGEALPYAHYGESRTGEKQKIKALTTDTIKRETLTKVLPAGAARNALDCALWDLESKKTGKRVWELIGIEEPQPLPCSYTISLDTPENMSAQAKEKSEYGILKIKLAGDKKDRERVKAIRAARHDTKLILDANEGVSEKALPQWIAMMMDFHPIMIEQPVKAGSDEILAGINAPFCADESFRTADDMEPLKGTYQYLNIKLDKLGGLTHAIEVKKKAEQMGFSIMIGCMVAGSLSLAPAQLLAQTANIADLDGAALLKGDTHPALSYKNGHIHPPKPELWG